MEFASVVTDHRRPVLDDRATIAVGFAPVLVSWVVRQGDTTREAESESGEWE
jgi:hypothetical protein